MAINQANIALNIIERGSKQAAANVDTLANSMARTANYAEQARRSMQLFAVSLVGLRIGQTLATIGQRAVEFTKKSIQMGFEWETQMRRVRTQTDLSTRAFARLSGEALRIAARLPFEFEDVSQSLYDIYSGTRLVGREGTRLLELTGQAAVAGATDIATATDAVIGAVNAFKLSMTDIPRLLDLQFQLVRFAKGDYEDFADALNNVYPSAVRFGQSMEQTFAAIAFASKGGAASPTQAIISVARAMDQLGRTKAVNAMERFGIAVYDSNGQIRPMIDILSDMSATFDRMNLRERAEALYDIFGVGGIQANRFLNRAIPGIKQLRQEFENFGASADGAMRRAFRIIMDENPELALQILANHFKALRVEVANRLAPTLFDLSTHGERLLDVFDRMSPSAQTLIARLVALGGLLFLATGRMFQFTANIAGARSMMELAGQSWGSITSIIFRDIAMMVVRFAAITAAIAAVVVAVRWLRENWEAGQHVVTALGAIAVTIFRAKIASAIRLAAFSVKYFAVTTAAAILPTTGLGAAIRGVGLAIKSALGPFALIFVAFEGLMWAGQKLKDAFDDAHRAQQQLLAQSPRFIEAFGRAAVAGIHTREELVRTIQNEVAWLRSEGANQEELNRTREAGTKALEAYDFAMRNNLDTTQMTVGGMKKVTEAARRQGVDLDKLTKKTRVFADMTMPQFEEWATQVSENVDLVGAAFGELGDDAKITADKVIRQFEKQIEAARNFFKNMRRAGRLGLSEAAAKYITDLGPQGQQILAALVAGGRDAIKRFNELFGTATRITDNYAEKAAGALQSVSDKTKRSLDSATRDISIYHDAMEKIPKNWWTTFGVDTRMADAKISAWVAKLRSMKINVHVSALLAPGTGVSLHTGGYVPGAGRQDVPAVLQAGEYVVQRDKAQRFAPLLRAINEGNDLVVSRTARAMMEKMRYHNGGPVVQYDMRSIGNTISRAADSIKHAPLASIGRWLQGLGYRVSEHPLFGGVLGRHVRGSYHYQGRAIDVNYYPASLEPMMLDRIYPILKKIRHAELLWRTTGHYNHLHYAMANGGILREPVMGFGMRTGATYSMAERGPEQITPITSRPSSSKTLHVEQHFYNSHVDAQEAINELEWARRTSIW